MRRGAGRWALLATLVAAVALPGTAARASVVRHGYLPLRDGTQLNYTLTLPSPEGRYPVVLQYDPYAAGATSDPTWNDSGYAMLGVNFRGTACSEGTFNPLRADIWGADGAQVVDWAAAQPWSDGNVGMIGYSFTGVSQLATAAYAGPALKAITPGNVFPDFYRDIIYPGGIHNGWIPAWIAARDFALGTAATGQATTDPHCAADVVQHVLPNATQSLDTQRHPYLDEFWATQPLGLLDRVQIPVLGCVNWQDTTVYSRAFNTLHEQLDPARTWVVGGNGAHPDCPISRARFVRFFDAYLKQRPERWQGTPHVILAHEVAAKPGVRGTLSDDAGAWQSAFARWSDLDAAITPLTLHLAGGGRLELSPPGGAPAGDSYGYPLPTANTPADFAGQNHWGTPPAGGGAVAYTTPPLAQDAEFAGSASADLWISSTATDSDVQLTLSEVRPDGQELYVQNGWLRLSHRRLDPGGTTILRPLHTDLERDAQPLTPGEPVLARVEVQPFDHVFRAGSALRLTIDAPGGYFQVVAQPATNTVHRGPGTDSTLVLGWLPGAGAHAPAPACGSLLNQPCRANALALPAGTLTLPRPPAPAAQLLIGRATGTRAARRGRPFAVAVRTRGGALRDAQIRLTDSRGRRLGASARFAVGARGRRVRVRVTRRLARGRYRLAGVALAPGGARVTAQRTLRLR